MQCPVCQHSEWESRPRQYPCGHTVCENCMLRMDEKVQGLYKCPLCRRQTVLPTMKRMVNLALCDAIDREFPAIEEDEQVPDNLAQLAETVRCEKAEQVYDEILPVVVDAAKEGKAYVLFKGDVARRMHWVTDKLSKMLFDKGIYGIDSSRHEVIVYILEFSAVCKETLINPDFDSDEDHEDMERLLHARSLLLRMQEREMIP